jgi:hypothetical protein
MENNKPKVYRKYTYEFVKARAEKEGGTEYTLLSTTYKTRKDKLLWRHEICGKEFLMDRRWFL